jgi:hypothetical protein
MLTKARSAASVENVCLLMFILRNFLIIYLWYVSLPTTGLLRLYPLFCARSLRIVTGILGLGNLPTRVHGKRPYIEARWR